MKHFIHSIRRAAANAAAAFAAAATLLLAACGGGSGTSTGPAADPATRTSVGAAGGSLASPDGKLTLTIPAGALGNSTEITITEVSAANLPASLKLLGAERIYKLEPDGLQFAQPVTASATLAAGNQPALMLLVGNGTTEFAAGMRSSAGSGERRVTGRIAHFSHLVVKTIESFTLELRVDKRELKVGDTVQADATLSKTAANDIDGVADPLESPDFNESEVLALDTTINADRFGDFVLAAGRADTFTSTSRWRCKKPGTEVIEYSFTIDGVLGLVPAEFLDATRSLPPIADAESRISAAIDVVCTAGSTVDRAIRTGLFTLPFGRVPDGIVVDQRSFANLEGTLAYIATSRGLVAIDLETALSVLNMTASGPDGALGDNLLGVQPISRPNPGRDTAAALFGTTTGGAGSYLRNWIAGAWGLIQVSPGVPYLDASNAGGAVVAEEMAVVAPTRGVRFVRYDVDLGFFSLIPGLDISLTVFTGELRAAVLPSEAPGSPVLVLTAGTDGATTSTLWLHLRQPGEPQGIKLASVPGADARRLRCLQMQALSAALAGRIPCIVTEYGSATAHFFIYDPANPTATPQVQAIPVGAGALGVQLAQRANGEPWAVVSNFGAGTLNIISMNAQGTVTANRTLVLPQGCLASAHAAPFSHGGRDYIAGTCSASDNYFVLEA